ELPDLRPEVDRIQPRPDVAPAPAPVGVVISPVSGAGEPALVTGHQLVGQRGRIRDLRVDHHRRRKAPEENLPHNVQTERDSSSCSAHDSAPPSDSATRLYPFILPSPA